MTAPALPAEVLALIRGPARTIAHVEMLLALRACAPAARSVEWLAAEANVPSSGGARDRLADLAAAGLLATDGEGTWHYAPRDAAARRAVDRLAAMYNEKPVTLVRALYEQPTQPRDASTDASRLRPNG